MRVDAHHHLWCYDPSQFGWIEPTCTIARDFTVEDLAAARTSAGVDATIAVQARQCAVETASLLAHAETCPEILGVVGWIDLRAPNIAERLEVEAASRLIGYRHVVQDEADPHFLLGEAFVAGVRAVARRGLTYDLLVNASQFATVPTFLDRVGDGRFVLDHGAKPGIAAGRWRPWADQIAEVATHPGVYCKVSGLVTEADHAGWRASDIEPYLAHLADCFGPDRLIWGSDWPVCLLAATYRQTFDLVLDFVHRCCPEAEPAIFGDAAMRAYGLEPQP